MGIVIPDHLRLTSMKLEHHGNKIRQHSKIKSGGDKNKETKTQVRHDNASEGLVLGIRKEKDGPWEFFQSNKLPNVDGSEPMQGVPEADEEF